MNARFRVTFETFTPESIEDGDAAERGYASPGGWKHEDPAEMTLREAIQVCGFYAGSVPRGGWGFEDSGSWFSTIDAEHDIYSGETCQYGIHPPRNITRASYARVARLLTGRTRD